MAETGMVFSACRHEMVLKAGYGIKENFTDMPFIAISSWSQIYLL